MKANSIPFIRVSSHELDGHDKFLTLKMLLTTAADDILICACVFFRENKA